MSIFKTKNNETYFDQGRWEHHNLSLNSVIPNSGNFLESNEYAKTNDHQFILLQLSDGEQRVVNTSQVVPKLQGSSDKPDINMLLDFDGFKIGSNEDIDKNTKATLQLQVGQEERLGPLEKLFYCVNGGLDLFNEIKGKKADSKDFKKSTDHALGNKPISLPGGVGQISLKVVKHEEQNGGKMYFRLLNPSLQRNYFL